MSEEDENPFNGFSEEDGDNAVWTTVAVLAALMVLALWCWVGTV